VTAELGIGLATFLPGYGINAQKPPGPDLLEEALDAGIRYFDTAPVYGSGDQELGKVVRATGLAHEVRICTKVAVADIESADEFIDAAQRSVERLGLERVHALLAHSANSTALQSGYIAQGMHAIRAAKLCDFAGASTYGVNDATTATAQRWCDVIQVEHSVLNPTVVHAIVHSRRRDQMIVGRSALAKGLLTPRRSAGVPIATSLAETINALEECAAEWGFSLPELAIRFALDTDGVNVVVVGVSSNEELGTALSASRRPPLTSAQLEALDRFDRSADDATHPERWPPILENRA
jgi:aryl-alcohol dehydrogenase-like predicted oxidoreductase